MTAPLVLVLRPGNPGKELADMLNMLGFAASHTPSLFIQPITTSAPAKEFDIYIFISPTSVENSFAIAPSWLASDSSIVAVGIGTAMALKRLGYHDVLVPEVANSEGMLAMDVLQAVSGQEILIIKGEGGRDLLQKTLIGRDANCAAWSVYRREPAEIQNNDWEAYRAANACYITCASIETLDSFETQRQAVNAEKPEQIFVASDRIADHAQALGYTGIIKAGGATNQHFITAITQHNS